MKIKHKEFYEILTIAGYINLVISNKYAFFNVKSFPLRLFEKMFRIDVYRWARRISFGDLSRGTGIRRNAYEAAIADLKKLRNICFDNSFRSLKKINSNLIFEKFYFNLLYEKYEFYGLASQFVAESDQVEFEVRINSLPLGLGKFCFDKKIKVVRSFSANKLAFFGSMLASTIAIVPAYLCYFLLRNKAGNAPHFRNAIVCEVDSPSNYEMYKDLFESCDNVCYVTSGRYAKSWTKEEIEKYGLIVTKLSLSGLQNIIILPVEYLIFCVRNFNELSGFGLYFLDLLKTIVDGNLITIDAENCIYFTYEHMFAARTFRNELLRVKNNRSVFICKTMYVINHYFHHEYKYNYDILCSSGPCLESIFAMQKAETNIFLPTGAYDNHKRLVKEDGFLLHPGVAENDGFQERVKRLNYFKGDSVAITILSTGVMDETYSEEVGLIRLARRLAAEPNVRVFIRQKPTRVVDKYLNFIADNLGSCESIMLTHMEYQLFDFLDVTDLFIVANSSAAVDLCPAGAQFFSVDFLEDNDMYLWQTLIEGVYIKEGVAFETIMNWVNDSPSGQRLVHQRRMQELAKLIAYQFGDFETYKQNFLTLLNPYLPAA